MKEDFVFGKKHLKYQTQSKAKKFDLLHYKYHNETNW
jgi:hypothetical protein